MLAGPRYSNRMTPPNPPFVVPAGLAIGPLGFVLRDGHAGRSVWEYRVDASHFTLNGTLHGGVLMALLDTAMGYAVLAGLPAGLFNAAAEMSTRFLAPVRSGVVTAE